MSAAVTTHPRGQLVRLGGDHERCTGRCTDGVAGFGAEGLVGRRCRSGIANDSYSFVEYIMNARLARGQVEETAAGLSVRDWQLLGDVGRLRLLSTQQIERLHFRDGSASTQARRARRTLQRLTNLGVVHRFVRRVGGVRAGSAGFVYGLDTLGQKLSSVSGPAGGGRRRKPWEPSALFFSHVLAVSELYVRLREAEREGQLDLIAFDGEPACWRRFSGIGGEAIILKPDAYVCVGVGEFEQHRFIEVDLASESLSVISQKADLYARYWRSGHALQERGVMPKVLFLVPDALRAEQITKALARQPADHWQLFQVQLFEHAVAAIAGDGPRAGPNEPAPEITTSST